MPSAGLSGSWLPEGLFFARFGLKFPGGTRRRRGEAQLVRRKMLIPVLLATLAVASSAQPKSEEELRLMLQNFESYAEKSRREWQTPGMAVALVLDNRVVYSRGFGVRRAGGNEPVTPETIFQIGSISKSFTAGLVAQLVDEKKLNWNDPITDAFPDFRLFDPWVTRQFTVEDSMAQRSGMPAYAGDLLAFMGCDREQILAAMRHIQPVSSFRSQFGYVNNLWLAAARVIEKHRGEGWEACVRGRIFEPLGMAHSSTGAQALYSAPNHADPHLPGSPAPLALGPQWPYTQWVYTYGPAGGINSNVLDMARYARAQLSGGLEGKSLWSRASLERMHTPHVYAGGEPRQPAENLAQVGRMSYCLGWIRQEMNPLPLVWHNGGTSGCKAVVGLVPDHNMAIVVLSNLGGTELPEALMYRFYDLALGRPQQDYSAQFLKTSKARQQGGPKRPASPQPPLALHNYAGSYFNPCYGELKIRVGEGQLLAQLGKNMRFSCQPWNRDTFRFDDFVNPADPPQFLTFQLSPEGKVTAVEVPSLGDASNGLFEKR